MADVRTVSGLGADATAQMLRRRGGASGRDQ
jgi:hypothetical protein